MKFLKPLATFFALSAVITLQAQDEGWHMLDPEKDQVQGISTEKAYEELLKGKESRTVIVAVIDGGVDAEHEDLKSVMWVNKDEIAGNGIDDDKNGYVDDVHGWNFIGGKDGNVNQDTYELTREYVRLKGKYADKSESDVSKKEKSEYQYWNKVKDEFEAKQKESEANYKIYEGVQSNLLRYHELIKLYLNKEVLTMQDLMTVQSGDSIIQVAAGLNAQILNIYGPDANFEEVSEELLEGVEYFGSQYKYGYNADFDPRKIVGDNYENSKDTDATGDAQAQACRGASGHSRQAGQRSEVRPRQGNDEPWYRDVFPRPTRPRQLAPRDQHLDRPGGAVPRAGARLPGHRRSGELPAQAY